MVSFYLPSVYVVLLSMVRFIEDEKINLINSDVAPRKAVVEDVSCANNHLVL